MSRIIYLDTARGLAIGLVVLGHAIQYTVPKFDDHVGFRLIYAVHMPLFMFISGYLTSLSEGGDAAARLRTKARLLLLPFITWLPVSFVAIGWLQRPEGFAPDFLVFVSQVLKTPDAGGLWFLLVLFECHLLLQLAVWMGPRRTVLVGALMLLALNVLILVWPASNWLGVGLLRWQFLFFLAGFVARKIGWQPPSCRVSWLWLFAFIVLALFWYRKSAAPVDLWLPNVGDGAKRIVVQGYHAITALAGIGATLGLCAALTDIAALASCRKLLDRLGRVSLEIYAAHYLFLYAAVRVTDIGLFGEGARIVFVAVVALLSAWALALALSARPLPRTLFYGR